MSITLTDKQIQEIVNILEDFHSKKTKVEEALGGTYIELNPHPCDILYILFPEGEPTYDNNIHI